jgi:hypothetical protein
MAPPLLAAIIGKSSLAITSAIGQNFVGSLLLAHMVSTIKFFH